MAKKVEIRYKHLNDLFNKGYCFRDYMALRQYMRDEFKIDASIKTLSRDLRILNIKSLIKYNNHSGTERYKNILITINKAHPNKTVRNYVEILRSKYDIHKSMQSVNYMLQALGLNYQRERNNSDIQQRRQIVKDIKLEYPKCTIYELQKEVQKQYGTTVSIDKLYSDLRALNMMPLKKTQLQLTTRRNMISNIIKNTNDYTYEYIQKSLKKDYGVSVSISTIRLDLTHIPNSIDYKRKHITKRQNILLYLYGLNPYKSAQDLSKLLKSQFNIHIDIDSIRNDLSKFHIKLNDKDDEIKQRLQYIEEIIHTYKINHKRDILPILKKNYNIDIQLATLSKNLKDLRSTRINHLENYLSEKQMRQIKINHILNTHVITSYKDLAYYMKKYYDDSTYSKASCYNAFETLGVIHTQQYFLTPTIYFKYYHHDKHPMTKIRRKIIEIVRNNIITTLSKIIKILKNNDIFVNREQLKPILNQLNIFKTYDDNGFYRYTYMNDIKHLYIDNE